MFVGARFNMNAIFQKYVGGAQNVFAGVGGVGDVMQTRVAAAVFFGTGQIIGFVVHRKPTAAQSAIVQLNIFGHARSQTGFHKFAEYGHILGQKVKVI